MAKLIKFITLEEFQRVLKAEKKKEYKLAYILAFGSGLRLSEITGFKTKSGRMIPALTRDKVDLQTHQIRLEGAKGNKDRITVTSPWLNETALKMLPLGLNRRTIEWRIKKLGREVLNKDIHFHTLRHGFGNYMHIDKKIPLTVLQQLMGHSRADTTAIYAQSNPVQAVEMAWDVWS